jgi:nitroreductase
LELALLSPSSSNLQPWEFYWPRSAELRNPLIHAFVNQAPANTAAEIIVAVARTATWDRNLKQICEILRNSGAPASTEKTVKYYEKTARMLYNQGLLNWRGFAKRIINWSLGKNHAIVRQPSSPAEMRLWAVKSTSLACQTFMMALTAAGFDTCPMEGFDPVRLRALLQLEKDAVIVMGIAIGKRAPNGITGPRVRLDSETFVKIL